jgi:hypothetical protein
MVYLLGIKQEQHLEHFRPQPHRLEQLQNVLNEPSLYDDVLSFMARRGYRIPDDVLARDFSRTYDCDPEVEKAWASAYESDPALKMLGETMADIAEEFTTWTRCRFGATHLVGELPRSNGQTTAWPSAPSRVRARKGEEKGKRGPLSQLLRSGRGQADPVPESVAAAASNH